MNKLLEHVIPWAADRLGLQLQAHQHARITSELQKLQKQFNITDEQFITRMNKVDMEFFNAIVSAITVQESYFFRDQSLFNLLRDHYLPALLEQKRSSNDYSLRIWSAGCARGEELYSIAILLHELIPDLSSWHIELLGTDVNNEALDEARKASYSQSSMRITDDHTKTAYFQENKHHFELKKFIQKHTHFKSHNLSANDYPPVLFDIIFCRNVFIYLKKDTIEYVLKRFDACLSSTGRLFLGPSDFLTYLKNPFIQHIEHGVTYYSKEKYKPHAIPKPTEAREASKLIVESYATIQAQSAELLKRIRQVIQEKNYAKALVLIDHYITRHKPTAVLYFYKAESLSALGDIETALDFCNKSITLDNMNAHVYHLKGTIELTLLHTEEAKHAFQKALIIKSDLIEAYYYLGKIAASHKHYDQALSILAQGLQVPTENKAMQQHIQNEMIHIKERRHDHR